MSLVLYSDSDSGSASGEDKAHYPLKRKPAAEPPPLPAAFNDLYSASARISTHDDPSLHGGRRRALPHIEGNWPSHVYLEWIPSHAESENLHRLLESVQSAMEWENKARAKPLHVPDITPSLRSPLGALLPLHISLSRTLQVKTHDRESFLDALSFGFRKAAVKPFSICFTKLKWVPNFERNRWFLVLGIEKPPEDELNALLDACNEACEKCGHPGLYIGGRGDGPMERNPSAGGARKRRRTNVKGEKKEAEEIVDRIDRTESFHISIAWNLIEPAPEWIALLQDIDVNKTVRPPTAPFGVVKAKIGNAIHNIQLGSKSSSTKRGRGVLGL